MVRLMRPSKKPSFSVGKSSAASVVVKAEKSKRKGSGSLVLSGSEGVICNLSSGAVGVVSDKDSAVTESI